MESYFQLGSVTLWDLKASSLGPLQIVYMTLNIISGALARNQRLAIGN